MEKSCIHAAHVSSSSRGFLAGDGKASNKAAIEHYRFKFRLRARRTVCDRPPERLTADVVPYRKMRTEPILPILQTNRLAALYVPASGLTHTVEWYRNQAGLIR